MRSVLPSSCKVERVSGADVRPRWRTRLVAGVCGLATASTLACAAVFVSAFATPACLTRACDPSQKTFGLEPGEGRLLDEDTWESSPLDGKWLPYPHQRTWVIYYGGYMKGRKPSSIDVFLAADERPNQAGSNFTVGGGDVVKMYNVTDDSMGLANGTCADYFVRVVVHAPRAAADAGATDATDATDAGDASDAAEARADAAEDAPADAAADVPDGD